MEFSHHPGTDDFLQYFLFCACKTYRVHLGVTRTWGPMSCPGVTAEVYPGATHLSSTTCTSGAHAHGRRISTAHDCGAGSSFGERERLVGCRQPACLPASPSPRELSLFSRAPRDRQLLDLHSVACRSSDYVNILFGSRISIVPGNGSHGN